MQNTRIPFHQKLAGSWKIQMNQTSQSEFKFQSRHVADQQCYV